MEKERGIKKMTDEQKNILDKYLERLELSGIKTKNPKFSLRVFFKYLNENEINFKRIKIMEAQDFQTFLVTKTDKKGNIYYVKKTASTIISCITSFYDYLVKKKIIYANPFLEIKKLKNPKMLPRNILNEEKTDKLLRALKDFHKGKDLIERKKLYKAHVMAELMYSTGARINEIANVRKADIDFIHGTVRIKDTKSNQERDAVLNEYAGKVLKIFISDMREYIIFGKNNADTSLLFGSKISLQAWFNAVLRKVSKKLRLGKYTSHMIRHSVGTHLLKNGCDIRYIQEILGHKDLTSTQIYTQIAKEDLKNVLDKYHPRVFRKRKK